ncbi:MAG: hypothetical protein FWD11_08305, partial [Micrococcales bacterium]|nr:hypothetical protein [Micrococcales bacterium]
MTAQIGGSTLRLGLDIGSTTLKAVLLDGEQIRCEEYRRHNADVHAELTRLVHDLARQLPGAQVVPAI